MQLNARKNIIWFHSSSKAIKIVSFLTWDIIYLYSIELLMFHLHEPWGWKTKVALCINKKSELRTKNIVKVTLEIPSATYIF